MPTQVLYIPNELYENLVLEARELGISVSKLIIAILRVYYEQKGKKAVPYRS